MRFDWVFAQQAYGVFVIQVRGEVIVLEYNEFLGRIADGRINAEDTILSRVLTNGRRCRADSLHTFELVCSGQVRTDDLPRRSPGGVLATGFAAQALLRRLESEYGYDAREPDPAAQMLLRPASAPKSATLSNELLRSIGTAPSSSPPEELPRASQAPEEGERPV